ncbi:hypothetical protein ES703_81664 [subsurface metagenome]
MVYVYQEKKDKGKIILVKANDREGGEQRLNLLENYEFRGSLTDAEMNALGTTSFGLITV